MSTKALCFLLRKREFGGDVAVFYNAVLIPKSKNMAKSMADFSDYPTILFAMFRRGSISDPSGVDMAPCHSVAILLNREAGIFFLRKSTIRPTSRISLQPLHCFRVFLLAHGPHKKCTNNVQIHK
jgi:hypothetical protein